MAAVLAPHHASTIDGFVVDRYGNDPFVWARRFLWSHCHARSRSPTFGSGLKGPLVHGKDAVFFLSVDAASNDVVVDCVFVIEGIEQIREAEAGLPLGHPARNYHFDQDRCKEHARSTLTRLANPDLSFVPHPPMPLGTWIEEHVDRRSMPALDYFRLPKRKNVRVVTSGAQELYERVIEWCGRAGHQRLKRVPLSTLQQIPIANPRPDEVVNWDEAHVC